MTVKELKEKLNELNDNLIVMIPNQDLYPFPYIPATHVAKGVNEEDGFVFVCNYAEEDE